MGAGSQQAKIMLIGEAPWLEEVNRGLPFQGDAGKLLDDILEGIGWDRHNDVYVTNVSKCCPEVVEDKPNLEEIRTCGKLYLEKEIEAVRPKYIVLMGGIAVKWWFNRADNAAVNAHRRTLLSTDAVPYKVFATYHPGAIVRNQNLLPTLVKDWNWIADQVEGLKRPSEEKAYYFWYEDDEEWGWTIMNGVLFSKAFACDTESTQLSPHQPGGYLLCAGITDTDNECVLIDEKDFRRYGLADALMSPAHKIFYNAPHDVKWFRTRGYNVRGPLFDGLVSEHLLDENKQNKQLYVVARERLGRDLDKSRHPAEMTKAELADYCGADTDSTLQIAKQHYRELKKQGLWPLFKMNMQFQEALIDAEMAGVRIDRRVKTKLEDQYKRKEAKALRWLAKRFGPLNPNSTKQMQVFLFNTLGFAPKKRTATGYSTDATTLEVLYTEADPRQRRALDAINAYRKASKLRGTFLTGLDKHLINGFLHPNYSLAQSVSRLSCSNPNLHNIPSRTDKAIRTMFRSRWRNGKIIRSDSSQAELRHAAEMSGDKALTKIFLEGIDPHAEVAARYLNIPLARVTDDQREMGKTTNFSIFYGAGPGRVAEQTGLSYREAERLIQSWFEQFPSVKTYLDQLDREMIDKGYITNLFGRRRRISMLDDVHSWRSQRALRQTHNFPIQSGVFDQLSISLTDIWREMKKSKMKSKFIMQVHDEGVWDGYPDEGEQKELAALIQEKMEHPNTKPFGVKLTVPLHAEVTCGPNWRDQDTVLAA